MKTLICDAFKLFAYCFFLIAVTALYGCERRDAAGGGIHQFMSAPLNTPECNGDVCSHR